MKQERDETSEDVRLPDLTNDSWMRSRVWKCCTCARVHVYAEPVTVPTPCSECKGIIFEKR